MTTGRAGAAPGRGAIVMRAAPCSDLPTDFDGERQDVGLIFFDARANQRNGGLHPLSVAELFLPRPDACSTWPTMLASAR